MLRLNINGKDYDVDVEPETPLLWAIRENVGLTGTKYGCGIAQCGACTVHVDGVATRSCSFPVSGAVNTKITTIEGLAQNGILHKVQKAWIEHDVAQCGYCQPGQIMAAVALVRKVQREGRAITEADLDTIRNVCRCGTYPRIRDAIKAGAQRM